jgi:hypothetical protein
MEIKRNIVCSCVSPYCCVNEKGSFLNNILATAIIENGDIKITVDEKFKDWVTGKLLLYFPLLINYQNIYDGYFKDLNF